MSWISAEGVFGSTDAQPGLQARNGALQVGRHLIHEASVEKAGCSRDDPNAASRLRTATIEKYNPNRSWQPIRYAAFDLASEAAQSLEILTFSADHSRKNPSHSSGGVTETKNHFELERVFPPVAFGLFGNFCSAEVNTGSFLSSFAARSLGVSGKSEIFFAARIPM